jgi:hypothetical protein
MQTHLKAEAELTLLSEVTLTEDLDDGALNRLDQVLGPMQEAFIHRRSQDIQRELAEAIRNGDSERRDVLDREKLDLMRMLSTLK